MSNKLHKATVLYLGYMQ